MTMDARALKVIVEALRAVEALSVLQKRAMHHPVLIDGVWECAWCQTVIESEPCAEWPAETQPDE